MMKKLFGLFSWVLILLSPVLVAVLLGFLAIRFNFWPPNCGVLPIPQAKRVCEFSKLEKAPSGKPAKITFWVTIPYDLPADKLFLSIDGKDPVEMDKINNLSFQKLISATTGETLKYKYLRNGKESFSSEKELKLKSLDKKVYDYVSQWSDSEVRNISKNLLPIVEMYDTWSINYNMQFFEDTRRNLDSAMARVKAIGGKEIGIYSFIEMSGDENNFIVQEAPAMPGNIFGQLKHKYGRDGSITEKEMKQIVKTAKKYGLKTTIYYNIEADYTKYIKITANPFASRGSGGNTAENRAGEEFGRYDPKTKEWLDNYFNQLKNVLVEWAKRGEVAGIDAFNLNPHYRPPTVAPYEAYANEKWREIIGAVRKVYSGKIYFDGNPAFRDEVDGLYVSAGVKVRSGAMISEIRNAWTEKLNSIEANFSGYNKPIFIMISPASYAGALSGKPGMEFLDYVEVEAAGYKRDWQGQADAYEGFFQALAEKKRNFAGFGTRFLSWDDMMGPEYIPSRYSDLASNIRNKPAEAVWEKWVLSAQ